MELGLSRPRTEISISRSRRLLQAELEMPRPAATDRAAEPHISAGFWTHSFGGVGDPDQGISVARVLIFPVHHNTQYSEAASSKGPLGILRKPGCRLPPSLPSEKFLSCKKSRLLCNPPIVGHVPPFERGCAAPKTWRSATSASFNFGAALQIISGAEQLSSTRSDITCGEG